MTQPGIEHSNHYANVKEHPVSPYFIFYGGARGVMVIVIGYGHGDPSSRQD